MSKTMKAAMVRQLGKAPIIEQVPIPCPGPGEVLSEPLAFAPEGKVKTHIHKRPLESINEVFADLKHGQIDGRIVIPFHA